MLRVLFVVGFATLGYSVTAQIQSVDVNAANNSVSGGTIRINNALGQAPGNSMNYSEIRGRYFWNEKWKPAKLVLRDGGIVNLGRVKLNLFTNEIHYIGETGSELVVQKGLVKDLLFATSLTDSTTNAHFRSLSGLTRDFKENYFQMLNSGAYKLLKLTTITLYKGDYDAMLGRRDFKFVSTVSYYLSNTENQILELKGLNKEALFSIVQATEPSEDYLSQHKNKLKNENEVVEFLQWLNSETKKQ